MNDMVWFNLPSNETAKQIQITIPGKGQIEVTAQQVAELDRIEQSIKTSREKHDFIAVNGSLGQQLDDILRKTEAVSHDTLQGSADFRDDVQVVFRALSMMLSSALGRHLNHNQKNERLRAAVELIEDYIKQLREHQFDFKHAIFNKKLDPFRWQGNEIRHHEIVRDLQEEIDGLKQLLSEAQQERDDYRREISDLADRGEIKSIR